MSKASHPSTAYNEKAGSCKFHTAHSNCISSWSFLLIAEEIHPNMRSLPAPDHPVLLCCACSSTSVPSSHWAAQTGHNTLMQHHRWGKNHTLSSGSTFVHNSVGWQLSLLQQHTDNLCSTCPLPEPPHVFSAVLLSWPSPSCHTGLFPLRCSPCTCLS